MTQQTVAEVLLRSCSGEMGGEANTSVLLKGVPAAKHTFWQEVAAHHKEGVSPFMIFVLF